MGTSDTLYKVVHKSIANVLAEGHLTIRYHLSIAMHGHCRGVLFDSGYGFRVHASLSKNFL